MKVRWKEHEMLMVTIIAAICLSSYIWNLTATRNNIADGYETLFAESYVQFNIYRNVLLPDLGMGLLIYLSYLFINLFTLPRLSLTKTIELHNAGSVTTRLKELATFTRSIKVGKVFSLVLQTLLIVLLLGTALNAAVYFKHQWQFNYPGFSIFFNRQNPGSQMDLVGNYAIVLFMMSLYGLYVFTRQMLIYLINTSVRKAYLTVITNQLTAFLAIYLSVVPVILSTSRSFPSGNSVSGIYFFAIPSMAFLFMLNIYWLFPSKVHNTLFKSRIIWQVLRISFICSLPFLLLEPGRFAEAAPFLVLGWLIQVFIVTPVSWLIYRQRKDKIVQLRGVQKALVKSRADLLFLRSQINPHFLFNVLNTLYGTALQEKAELTASAIQKLGDMMRFMLHDNNLDFISMEKEVEYIKNYIALQKMRTQLCTEVMIEDNLSEQPCSHTIAPMILIPLIENAFKHGISLREKSWINISLTCPETQILFSVRNSIHSRHRVDSQKENSGIGLNNVSERLKLLYPGKHRLRAHANGNEFIAELSIQL